MTSIYPSGNSSTASSGTSSANLLRVSGMASGIDTDAVVKSMVSNYQSKIDKANQDKQILKWKQDEYRDIIKGVKGLQEYFDPLSSKYMLSGNSLNINTATSDNTSIISATSASTAKAGNYKVNVSQLATKANIQGSSNNSLIAVTDLSKWKSGEKLDFGGAGSITLSKNPSSMSDLVTDINKQIAASGTLNGKISASYVNDGVKDYIKFTKSASAVGNITLSSTGATTVSDITSFASNLAINSGISSTSKLSDLGSFASDISFKLTNGTTDYNVSLTVGATTTMQDLMNKVNSTTDGAVTMSVDDTTGKISFQSKGYGSASSIAITNISADATTNLGISSTTSTGTDAIVAITAPGQSTPTTTTQSSNQFTINGVGYNLTGINAVGATSNVTVIANSDTVVSNVKKFIEDYNTLISTINTKLTEKKDNNYSPLTDEQKKSMSETQITAWETKAKVGILRKDDYLSNLMTQLRGTFYSPVYSNGSDTSTGKLPLSFGAYGTGSVGIETSTDYTDGGKLVLKDENKLKNVIENNMDDFKKLFIGASSSTLAPDKAYVGSPKYNEDGIFKRIDNITRDYVAAPGLGKDGTYTLSGYMNIFVNKQYDFSNTGSSGKNTLPDQVYKKALSVNKYQTQLSDAQSRYYAKFAALEKAMNSLNSQQSSLGSILGTS